MQRYREGLGGVVAGVFALEDLGAAFCWISGGLGFGTWRADPGLGGTALRALRGGS